MTDRPKRQIILRLEVTGATAQDAEILLAAAGREAARLASRRVGRSAELVRVGEWWSKDEGNRETDSVAERLVRAMDSTDAWRRFWRMPTGEPMDLRDEEEPT